MTAHDASGGYGSQGAGGSGDTEDLIRSVALSSARLWEELLGRLERVERSNAELRESFARLQASLPPGTDVAGRELGQAAGAGSWSGGEPELAPPAQHLDGQDAGVDNDDFPTAAHAARSLTAKDAVDLLFGDNHLPADAPAGGSLDPSTDPSPPRPWEVPDREHDSHDSTAGEPATGNATGNGNGGGWLGTTEPEPAAQVTEPAADDPDQEAAPAPPSSGSSWATFEPSVPEPEAAPFEPTSSWATFEPSEPEAATSPADTSTWATFEPITQPSSDEGSDDVAPTWFLANDEEPVTPTAPPRPAAPEPVGWTSFATDEFGAVPAPPPPPPAGFESLGDFAPPPPPPPPPPSPAGFEVLGDEPVPPPPPPGFESFGDIAAPPPPPGFEPLGDIAAPPPPPPGFATPGRVDAAPAPPPPPPGFESFADIPAPPPPPPGFAAPPATSYPPASAGGGDAETHEVEDVPITPDFFARAGRRR